MFEDLVISRQVEIILSFAPETMYRLASCIPRPSVTPRNDGSHTVEALPGALQAFRPEISTVAVASQAK